MKKNFINLFIFSTMLLSDFIIFAQPNDDDPGGDLEDDDPAAVPINGKLLWLALAGILFAISVYKNNRKEKEA